MYKFVLKGRVSLFFFILSKVPFGIKYGGKIVVTNIQIYFFQKKDTNKYPNIFV